MPLTAAAPLAHNIRRKLPISWNILATYRISSQRLTTGAGQRYFDYRTCGCFATLSPSTTTSKTSLYCPHDDINRIHTTNQLVHRRARLLPYAMSLHTGLASTSRQFSTTTSTTIYLPRYFSTNSSGRGRSRKHSRQRIRPKRSPSSSVENDKDAPTKKQSKVKSNSINKIDDESNEALPYPKGQPWRVLWPQPHGSTELERKRKKSRRIPKLADFRRAWALYKETWEDGISGRPSAAKLERQRLEELERELAAANAELKSTTVKPGDNRNEQEQKLKEVGDNAARNIRLIRKDAQQLLDQAKNHTGIHTQDDLKAVASQMMQIATQCIQEFMAGYRHGRDQEIDKMLNEYFREEDDNNSSPDTTDQQAQTNKKHTDTPGTEQQQQKKRKRRKPKRGIPRD